MVVTKAAGPASLNELAAKLNATSHDKGWYDKERTSFEALFLLAGEAFEAGEELRDGHTEGEVYFERLPSSISPLVDFNGGVSAWAAVEEAASRGNKPEGVPIELADVIIRTLDFAHEHGIDIEAAIRTKHAFNLTRPYRHGGKTL